MEPTDPKGALPAVAAAAVVAASLYVLYRIVRRNPGIVIDLEEWKKVHGYK